MPTFKQVIDCRRVDLALVPENVRMDMLRQQIRFRVEDLDTSDNSDTWTINGDTDDIKSETTDVIENALHSHTKGLFAMEVEYLDSYTPNPSMVVTVFFERLSDKQAYLKDFMVLHKLAN